MDSYVNATLDNCAKVNAIIAATTRNAHPVNGFKDYDFVDYVSNDYRMVTSISAVVNNGANELWAIVSAGITSDIVGSIRIVPDQYNQIDVGCYEYVDLGFIAASFNCYIKETLQKYYLIQTALETSF